jgi:hypothetical protein
MTKFKENTELLRTQLEAGDIDTICKEADCVPNTLYSAFARTEAAQLSGKEQTAYKVFVTFVKKKIRDKKNLESFAAEIADEVR